jgi:hypothetical protein
MPPQPHDSPPSERGKKLSRFIEPSFDLPSSGRHDATVPELDLADVEEEPNDPRSLGAANAVQQYLQWPSPDRDFGSETPVPASLLEELIVEVGAALPREDRDKVSLVLLRQLNAFGPQDTMTVRGRWRRVRARDWVVRLVEREHLDALADTPREAGAHRALLKRFVEVALPLGLAAVEAAGVLNRRASRAVERETTRWDFFNGRVIWLVLTEEQNTHQIALNSCFDSVHAHHAARSLAPLLAKVTQPNGMPIDPRRILEAIQRSVFDWRQPFARPIGDSPADQRAAAEHIADATLADLGAWNGVENSSRWRDRGFDRAVNCYRLAVAVLQKKSLRRAPRDDGGERLALDFVDPVAFDDADIGESDPGADANIWRLDNFGIPANFLGTEVEPLLFAIGSALESAGEREMDSVAWIERNYPAASRDASAGVDGNRDLSWCLERMLHPTRYAVYVSVGEPGRALLRKWKQRTMEALRDESIERHSREGGVDDD